MSRPGARPQSGKLRRWAACGIALLMTVIDVAVVSSIETPMPPMSMEAIFIELPELLRDVPARETKPAGFKELIPGKSSAAQVLEKFGEPQEKVGNTGESTWIYQIGPFPRVEAHLKGEQLESVRAEFAAPRPIEEILKELKLTKYAAVPDYTPSGAIASVLYPERGLRIGVHPQRQDHGVFITLGIPNADDFVLRAERDRSSQFVQQLADIHQALTMNAQHERALVLRSQIWCDCGFAEVALNRILQAQQHMPESRALPLEVARLQMQHGHDQIARDQLQELLKLSDLDLLLRCRARFMMVDLDVRAKTASDPRPLVNELVKIIQTAAPLTKEGTFGERVDARKLILDCHLLAAVVISESEWRNRPETTSKWLKNAESIAQTHIQQERTAPAVLLTVWHAGMQCHANLSKELDAEPLLDRMSTQVEQWLTANPDPLFQRHVRVLYASSLLYAVRAFQLRGDLERAEAIAQNAAEVAGQIAQQQPPHREAELLLGHALFSIGAIDGVGRGKHEQALSWYDRAEPLLVAPVPDWCHDRRALVGDQLVSMGLSNWAMDERQRAIELTEKGLEQLQLARKAGRSTTDSLAVALNNLAFMHSEVGNRDKAREFHELARRLEE